MITKNIFTSCLISGVLLLSACSENKREESQAQSTTSVPSDTVKSIKDLTETSIHEEPNNSEEVIIGTQTWTSKNLDITTFSNGDSILEAGTNEEWETAAKNEKPAWRYHPKNPEDGKKYGKLYNWYAVIDERGLAPKGWHIPSDNEWEILVNYLGGKFPASSKMKSTSGWIDYGNGTNESGFGGLPGGFYEPRSTADLGYVGNWWSSSKYCHYFRINFPAASLGELCSVFNFAQDIMPVVNQGRSVRCIKD